MAFTDSEPVRLTIKDRSGDVRSIEIPGDAEYNLMEVLKTFNYKMRATCGGMGLCADCHCRVVEGLDRLPEPAWQELETLDVIPDTTPQSRLSCQLIPGDHLRGVYLELLGTDHY